MTPALAYFEAWALAFALTQLVEVPVYRALAPVSVARAFGLSLATHPAVWYVFPLLATHDVLSWTHMVWLAEVFAYLVEAALLRACGIRWPRALVVSCAANTASVLAGQLTRALWGIP